MEPPPNLTWSELIDAFVEHERAVAGLAPETLRHRSLYLRTFVGWWEQTRRGQPVGQATTADLTAFLVAETERGMSPRTRKGQTAALRRFFSWLVLTGRARSDPTVQLRGPRVAPVEIEVYRPSEIATILHHTSTLTDLRGRLRHLIVSTLRFTGMRSGELRTLRRDRLDLEAGQAQVIGKGSRPRTVVIPAPLEPILRTYLDEVRPSLPSSPLLLSNPARRVTTAHHGFGPEAIHREVELAGQHAGAPGRHFPHRWRHTFATELVRAGVDIHVVQRLLGHRSVSSTVGYTHLATDDLQRAIQDLW
jgi:site-specific recombinase XerD